MENFYKKLLETAACAPSGDNMQPWKFSAVGLVLTVHNVPQKDQSFYNYRHRAAFISHGCLMENISLIAPTLGYIARFEYFPNPNNQNITAKITFEKTDPFYPPLADFIKKRQTNRKPYKNLPLTEKQKDSFLNLFLDQNSIGLKLIINKTEVEKIAAAVCQGDRMIFENKAVHDFLFSHIRWTEKDELKQKNGLYLKTMELSPPQRAAFKLFKNWGTMKIFNSIGFPKMAVKSNFPLYTNVSALVALTTKSHEPATYIELGRLLQRFWLTATKEALSIHPLTGIPFLWQRIKENSTQGLEDYQTTIIKEAYQTIAGIVGVKDDSIGFLFRLGHAVGPPSSLSSRQDPEIEIKD